MEFKVGDIVETKNIGFECGGGRWEKGAKAEVCGWDNWLRIKWLDSKSCGQMDGGYRYEHFILNTRIDEIPEIRPGNKIRISKEPKSWSSHFGNKNPMHIGLEFPRTITVEKVGDGDGHIAIRSDDGYCWVFIEDCMEVLKGEIINNNVEIKNMNNLEQKIASAKMTDPLKSLVKFGITGQNGKLTVDGQEVFINWLFEGSTDAFVKDIVAVLKKADKESKEEK